MLHELTETKVVRVDGVDRYIIEWGTIARTQGCMYLPIFVYSRPNVEKQLVWWLERWTINTMPW